MHDVLSFSYRTNEASKKLMSWVEAEINKGQECFDYEAAGAVIDMIKDFAETKEKDMKAKYYEALLCDFISGGDESDMEGGPSNRFGYDNWRYASGRFAPKGRGHRVGYVPDLMQYEGKDGEIRMGNWEAGMTGNRMGYPMDRMGRHHQTYDDYQMARKHYTETKSEADRHNMMEKMKELFGDLMDTSHEMYKDASPELRKEMKMEAKEMLEAFEHMG